MFIYRLERDLGRGWVPFAVCRARSVRAARRFWLSAPVPRPGGRARIRLGNRLTAPLFRTAGDRARFEAAIRRAHS